MPQQTGSTLAEAMTKEVSTVLPEGYVCVGPGLWSITAKGALKVADSLEAYEERRASGG